MPFGKLSIRLFYLLLLNEVMKVIVICDHR